MHEKQFELILNEFDCEEARFANKALDFMDGEQLTHVVNLLNHPNQGRRQWQQRGMRACYRNITGNIIEKSGLLFINGRPDIVVETGDDIDDFGTELVHAYLDNADFATASENLDQVVRLLKTALILTQYNSEEDMLYFDILHRGNCVVHYDNTHKKIELLAFKYDYSHYDDKSCGIRVFTNEMIEDWVVDKEGKTHMVEQVDNMYGHIPATVFYDTKTPRNGFWSTIPKDLVLFNEEYNMYLVDTMYAASYANRKTLFTNAAFSDDQTETLKVEEYYGDTLPRQTNNDSSVIAGPDKIVQLDTTGVDNIFLDYKGPDIRLEEIRQLFTALARDVAADWSVRIKVDGEGTASSGFQVIVEEMNNLELRKQRQRSMEIGMKNLFKCIKSVVNAGFGREQFKQDSNMVVEFADPSLPVDIKAEDQMWIERINNGLATRVDYFMSMKNMSEEEAMEEVQRLKDTGNLTLTPQEHKTLLDAYLSGAISHESYLLRLKQAGLVPVDREVTDEMSLIEAQEPRLEDE